MRGIHSYSQSPAVQLQSHLLSLSTLHSLFFFCLLFFFFRPGPGERNDLWMSCSSGEIGGGCFITPPGAPSSGHPCQRHTHNINIQTQTGLVKHRQCEKRIVYCRSNSINRLKLQVRKPFQGHTVKAFPAEKAVASVAAASM